MSSGRRFAVAVVAALMLALAGLLAWRFGQGAATGSAPDVPGQFASEARDAATAGAGAAELAGQRHAAGSGDTLPGSPMDWVERAARMSDIEAKLLRQARQGDTQAIAAVLTLDMLCRPFYPMRGDRDHPRHKVRLASEGAAERSAREAALRAMMSYCDRPPSISLEEARALSDQLRVAAMSGDVAAKAYDTETLESEEELLTLLREADEPWMIWRALESLGGREGRLIRQVEREVFSPEIRLLIQPSDIGRIKAMAARWRACELGAPCGPNQHYELTQCLYLGNCGLGMDVRTYIRERELSGWQFELMQKYLAALDARLAEAGVRRFATRPPGG